LSNDLNVKVDATTSPYEAAIGRAQNSTLRYDASLKQLESDLMKLEKQLDDDVAAALHRQHDAMTKVGKAAFVFGTGVAVALGMAANEAIKWESAWTGVTKTADGSEQQMAALEQQLRQLATTLPTTHEEIAAVAEAAGQLGVQRDNIAAFTKTMIDLSQTTNLTADEAATAMARFANIMQTPQDEVDRLGASLVALGNDGASTEAEILAMGLRIAGAGKQIGLTEGEVMGLANALSSVGIEAEAGGSAISSVIKRIQIAVSEGGDKLEKFAAVAGLTGEEFATLWRNDAAAGINAVVTGLGRVGATGGDTISVLKQLGVTEIRQSDALLRLSGAGDLLAESLQLGNQAWDENTALLVEAEKRYGTTAAQVAIARNEMRDAAITMGDTLLPAIAAVASTISDMIRFWQDLPGPIHDVVTIMALAAAGIGLFGGAALIAIPKIVAFQTAVKGLEAGALKSAGTRLMGLGGFLAGPWGLAIAGGITALGIFAAKQGEVSRKAAELRDTLDEQTGAVTENTREWAKKQLFDDGTLQRAKMVGLDLAKVTDAALGQADAIAYLNQQLQASIALDVEMGRGTNQQTNGIYAVMDAVTGQNTALQQGIEEKQLMIDADGAVTTAQKGTTAAWKDGATAAGDLAGEAKTLGEQMSELAESYLNQRDADRAVRSSLRDIREALKDYRKEHDGLKGAFREGSRSGDEFGSMLDDLAADYTKALEAAEKNGAGQKHLRGLYKDSFDQLVAMADQLGMTDEEAKAYAETVLGLPSDYYFNIQSDIDAQAEKLRNLRDQAVALGDQRYFMYLTTVHDTVVRRGGDQVAEENGGIVTAYAGGGIDGAGGYVPRVSQIARGGRTIMWAEPSTGWEAYISGKPGMEARNRDIWLEAGRRLGTVPEALQSASYNGGGGGGYGGGGGGGMTVIKQVMPGRFELVLDNGERLTGHIAGIATSAARDVVDAHAEAAYSSGGSYSRGDTRG